MFADKAIAFFRNLRPPQHLPPGVETLYPHRQPAVQEAIQSFFHKYYNDNLPRYMLVGINPGRFGAGITGINFTAPRQLSENCGIGHPFDNTSELSAEFMYTMIEAFGGTETFFKKFYIGSVSPIGFTQNGKNLNYYDDPKLAEAIRPFALKCLRRQISFGINRRVAICIGGDKNHRFLRNLNEEYDLFDELLVVPHPRFIMQYRRSQLSLYIQEYLNALLYCVKE